MNDDLGCVNSCSELDSCSRGCSEISPGCGCDRACAGLACGGGSGIPVSPGYYMLASVLMLPPSALRPRARSRGGWFLSGLPRRFGMWLIALYQRHISPRLPITCPYSTSCSRYGMAAVERYGLIKGSRLALLRIMRCRPDVPHGTVDELK